MEIFAFVGFVLLLLFMPQITSRAKLKKSEEDNRILRGLGYRYDWSRYREIEEEVRAHSVAHPETHLSDHEFGKAVNRKCEREKLLNRSSWERK